MPGLRSVEDIMSEIEKRAVESIEEFGEEMTLSTDAGYDNSGKHISREGMLAFIDAYKKYRGEDKVLLAIINDTEKLISTGKEYGDQTDKEKKLYFSIQSQLDKYIEKIDLASGIVEEEARKKLCLIVDGKETWPDDTDFQRNPDLYKIEGLLNKRKDSLVEKRSLADMIRKYLSEQVSGGLEIDEADEKAVFMDCTGKTLHIVDKVIPTKVIPYREYADPETEKDDYPLFPSIPHTNNIMQRKAYDCYFLSALSLLTEEHSEDIRNCMKDNHDGTVTVRFYGKTRDGEIIKVYVTVDKVVSAEGEIIINGPEGCIWASCLERALAMSGLYDCINRQLPYTLPVPDNIEEIYAKLKEMKTAGTLKDEALSKAEKDYPWLFSIGTEKTPPRLRPWPRVDSLIEGYVGEVFEAVLGEKFNSVNVVLPKSDNDDEDYKYTEDEIRFFKFIEDAYNHDFPVIACSSLESKLIREAHSYGVMGGKVTSSRTRYIFLNNPWGSSDGIKTSSYGVVPVTDKNGSQQMTWALVDNGIFPLELRTFLREFDFVDVIGLNRFDMRFRGGLGLNSDDPEENRRMEKVFYEIKERLDKAMRTGDPQTPYIMKTAGSVDPSRSPKEIFNFSDEEGLVIEYFDEEGLARKDDFKDVYFQSAGFLFRDERFEVLHGKVRPGEEDPFGSCDRESVMGGDEFLSLEDEPISPRVALSYKRIVGDIEKVMAATKRFTETDSAEFRNLLKKLQRSDTLLLGMADRPFSDLKEELASLTPYVEAYERYCSNHPEASWRRSVRNAACKLLKKTISNADSLLKKPARSIYMKYAEYYAVTMSKKKGITLNSEYKQKLRESLFNNPEFYEILIKKNIFYLEYAQDKEFIEHLNAMMQ